jgi:hypothetical protein
LRGRRYALKHQYSAAADRLSFGIHRNSSSSTTALGDAVDVQAAFGTTNQLPAIEMIATGPSAEDVITSVMRSLLPSMMKKLFGQMMK